MSSFLLLNDLMRKSVGSYHSSVVAVGAGGNNALEELECKLGDLVDLAACVVKQTAAAGIGSAEKSAKTDILNVKARGLILDIPLLLKCKRELFDQLIDLYVVLLCKLAEGILVARKICGTGADSEVVLDCKCVSKLCRARRKNFICKTLQC